MKIPAQTRNLTLSSLRDHLQKKFPDDHFLIFGRTLMVHRSLLEGCGVVIKSGSISIQPLPASLATLAITAALFALLLIPGCIFMLILFAKSGNLVKEVGATLNNQLNQHRPNKAN